MMIAMFHVFVEGAKAATPDGVKRLAEAIAAHYGLPVADMSARFASGRFRVKGNCDRATAEQYKKDLEGLGARVTIEAATAANSYPTPPAGTPVVKAPPPQYASGLAAAFSGEMPAASLGALENAGGSLSLASVDGSDTGKAVSEAAFAPPPAEAPAKPAASEKPAKPAKPPKPKDEPVDLFMPPDAEDAKVDVSLADDEIERNAKKRASTPPPVAAEPKRRSQPSIQAVTLAPERSHPLADERVRLVAGVVLAILIGFVPAHFVASMRESSAYSEVDANLVTTQKQVTTQAEYDHLDEVRADALDRKKSDRRSIAIMALAIWAVVGGAVAYGFFRKIDWDRFA